MIGISVAELFSRQRSAFGTVMAVGNIEFGYAGESFDKAFGLRHAPDGLPNSCGVREIIKRLLRHRLFDQRPHLISIPKCQKNKARLRSQLNHMVRAVANLIRPGLFVFFYKAVVVIVDRTTADDTGLLMIASRQAVNVN